MIITLPLILKGVGPSCTRPELRLFEIDGFRAGVERTKHATAQILTVAFRWRNVRNFAAAVQYQLAAGFLLGFVPVFLTVKIATQIIAIRSPRNSGHHRDTIVVLFPTA